MIRVCLLLAWGLLLLGVCGTAHADTAPTSVTPELVSLLRAARHLLRNR